MLSDEQIFHRAIWQNPQDAAHWNAYSDWLAEQGHHEAADGAARIAQNSHRLQVGLFGLIPVSYEVPAGIGHWGGNHFVINEKNLQALRRAFGTRFSGTTTAARKYDGLFPAHGTDTGFLAEAGLATQPHLVLGTTVPSMVDDTAQHRAFVSRVQRIPGLHLWNLRQAPAGLQGHPHALSTDNPRQLAEEAIHWLPEAKPQQMSRRAQLRQVIKNRRPVKATRGGADEQAFIKGIQANHYDQAPRLVYSDWLEEHGADDEANAHRHLAQLTQDRSSPWREAQRLHAQGKTPEAIHLLAAHFRVMGHHEIAEAMVHGHSLHPQAPYINYNSRWTGDGFNDPHAMDYTIPQVAPAFVGIYAPEGLRPVMQLSFDTESESGHLYGNSEFHWLLPIRQAQSVLQAIEHGFRDRANRWSQHNHPNREEMAEYFNNLAYNARQLREELGEQGLQRPEQMSRAVQLAEWPHGMVPFADDVAHPPVQPHYPTGMVPYAHPQSPLAPPPDLSTRDKLLAAFKKRRSAPVTQLAPPEKLARRRPRRFAASQADHDAMLAAIRARPDDQAPRLIYADMLEENGAPEIARTIREFDPRQWYQYPEYANDHYIYNTVAGYSTLKPNIHILIHPIVRRLQHDQPRAYIIATDFQNIHGKMRGAWSKLGQRLTTNPQEVAAILDEMAPRSDNRHGGAYSPEAHEQLRRAITTANSEPEKLARRGVKAPVRLAAPPRYDELPHLSDLLFRAPNFDPALHSEGDDPKYSDHRQVQAAPVNVHIQYHGSHTGQPQFHVHVTNSGHPLNSDPEWHRHYLVNHNEAANLWHELTTKSQPHPDRLQQLAPDEDKYHRSLLQASLGVPVTQGEDEIDFSDSSPGAWQYNKTNVKPPSQIGDATNNIRPPKLARAAFQNAIHFNVPTVLDEAMRGLLAKIHEHPHDEAPKLIYADRLEELGYGPLAAAIRQAVAEKATLLPGQATRRGIVSRERGSWRWQDAFGVQVYRPERILRPHGQAQWLYKLVGDVPGLRKVSAPQLRNRGLTAAPSVAVPEQPIAIQEGVVHQTNPPYFRLAPDLQAGGYHNTPVEPELAHDLELGYRFFGDPVTQRTPDPLIRRQRHQRELLQQAIRLVKDTNAPPLSVGYPAEVAEAKPDGCTCSYPQIKLRNGSGHGKDLEGKPCPCHKEWLKKNVWGKKKGETKHRRDIDRLHNEWGIQDEDGESNSANLRRSGRPRRLMRGGEEEMSFLARLRENPYDAAPRLIYADWLDEHGDENSATSQRKLANLLSYSHPIDLLTHVPGRIRPQDIPPKDFELQSHAVNLISHLLDEGSKYSEPFPAFAAALRAGVLDYGHDGHDAIGASSPLYVSTQSGIRGFQEHHLAGSLRHIPGQPHAYLEVRPQTRNSPGDPKQQPVWYSHPSIIYRIGIPEAKKVLDEFASGPFKGVESSLSNLQKSLNSVSGISNDHSQPEQMRRSGKPSRFTELATRDAVGDDHWKQMADYLEQHGLPAAATVVRSGKRISPEEYDRWRSRQFLSGAEVIRAALGGHAKVQGRHYTQGNLQGEFLHFPAQGHGLFRLGAWLQSIGQPSAQTPPDEDFPWAATQTSHEYAEPQAPVAFHVTDPHLAHAAAQEIKTTAELHQKQLAAQDGPEALPWNPPKKALLRRSGHPVRFVTPEDLRIQRLVPTGRRSPSFHRVEYIPHQTKAGNWVWKRHRTVATGSLKKLQNGLWNNDEVPPISFGLHGKPIDPQTAKKLLPTQSPAQMFHTALIENPHDKAIWGALGDHLAEQGKSAWGDLLTAATHHGREARDFQSRSMLIADHPSIKAHFGQKYGAALSAHGSVAGIPVSLLGQTNPTDLWWSVNIHDKANDGPRVLGYLRTTGDHGASLIRELDEVNHQESELHKVIRPTPSSQDEVQRFSQLYPPPRPVTQPQPEQMSRRDMVRQAIQMAALRDRPISVAGAQSRIGSSNHYTLIQTLQEVLNRSGLRPNKVYPAIHDVSGAARAAAVAEVLKENTAASGPYGTAWQGLIAKLPNLVLFRSHPKGVDSVYRVGFKGPQVAFAQLLDKAGIASRTFVPHNEGSMALIYDRGRSKRDSLGQLAAQLGLQIVEHTGYGEPHGGGDDMGRASYRDTINATEQGAVGGSQQPVQQRRSGRPVKNIEPREVEQISQGMGSAPLDRAPVGIIADALEEQGHKHWPHLLRQVAQHGVPDRWNSGLLYDPENLYGLHGTTNHSWLTGHVHGLPVAYIPVRPDGLYDGPHTHALVQFGDSHQHQAMVPLHESAGLLEELTPKKSAQILDNANLKAHFLDMAAHGDQPEQMRRGIDSPGYDGRRPVRNAEESMAKWTPNANDYDAWLKPIVRGHLKSKGYNPDTVFGFKEWEKAPLFKEMARFFPKDVGMDRAATHFEELDNPSHALYQHPGLQEDFHTAFWETFAKRWRSRLNPDAKVPPISPMERARKKQNLTAYRRRVRDQVTDPAKVIQEHVTANPGVSLRNLGQKTLLEAGKQRQVIDQMIKDRLIQVFRTRRAHPQENGGVFHSHVISLYPPDVQVEGSPLEALPNPRDKQPKRQFIDDPATHPTTVQSHIAKKPGIGFADLKKATNLPSPQRAAALNALLSQKLIIAIRKARQGSVPSKTVFFPADHQGPLPEGEPVERLDRAGRRIRHTRHRAEEQDFQRAIHAAPHDAAVQQQLQALHGNNPAQLGRDGGPVRLSNPEITKQLWQHADESPHDAAPWLITADALEEQGLSHAAHIMRLLGHGEVVPSSVHYSYRIHDPHGHLKDWFAEQPQMGAPRHMNISDPLRGQVGGIPIVVAPYRSRLQPSTDSLGIRRHALVFFGNGSSNYASLPLGQIQSLLREIRPVAMTDSYAERLRYLLHEANGALGHYGEHPAPERMQRRPVKATRGDADEWALLNGIRANPQDHARRLIYSDWLEDHGDDRSLQEAATQRHIVQLHQQGTSPVKEAIQNAGVPTPTARATPAVATLIRERGHTEYARVFEHTPPVDFQQLGAFADSRHYTTLGHTLLETPWDEEQHRGTPQDGDDIYSELHHFNGQDSVLLRTFLSVDHGDTYATPICHAIDLPTAHHIVRRMLAEKDARGEPTTMALETLRSITHVAQQHGIPLRQPEKMAKATWRTKPENIEPIAGNPYHGRGEDYYGATPTEEWLKDKHYRGTGAEEAKGDDKTGSAGAGWTPVRSSWIAGIRRVKGTNTVDMFTKKGVGYRYNNVPKGLYRAWVGAGSKGRFWWGHIRDALSPATRLMRAIRMAKGLPVRCSTPETVAELHRALSDHPHDSARWGILADAVEEMGRPGIASLLRLLMNGANTAKKWGGSSDKKTYFAPGFSPSEVATLHPAHYMAAGGATTTLFSPGIRLLAAPVYPENGDSVHGGMFHIMGHHASANNGVIGWATVPLDQARHIMEDLSTTDVMQHGTEEYNENNLESHQRNMRHFPPEQASKLQRGTPVRLTASPEEIQQLHAAITADPGDNARWLIASDALEENGHSGLASLYRHIVSTTSGIQALGYRRHMGIAESGIEATPLPGQAMVRGEIAGIPIYMQPHHHNGMAPEYWRVNVGPHGVGFWPAQWIYTTTEMGQQLLSEMTKTHDPGSELLRQQYLAQGAPSKEPEQLQRGTPVRLMH